MHVPGSSRSIELRLIEGDTVSPTGIVRPRTSLMRHGLHQETPASYFLFEEEVPRSGA